MDLGHDVVRPDVGEGAEQDVRQDEGDGEDGGDRQCIVEHGGQATADPRSGGRCRWRARVTDISVPPSRRSFAGSGLFPVQLAVFAGAVFLPPDAACIPATSASWLPLSCGAIW